MPYQFALTRDDYADFAAGHVFYGVPGRPALPVRLTSEIFQRCLAQRDSPAAPVTIYDPCCGGAYHLSTLAYQHWPQIKRIVASDIDGDVLATAAANLSLLTPAGLARRAAEIAAMQAKFGKAAHAAAAAAANRLELRLQQNLQHHTLATRTFAADATSAAALAAGLDGTEVDIIITDVPYGQLSNWQGRAGAPFVTQMLAALQTVITPATVLAIVADKGQKVEHPAFARTGRFQIGKRRITLLELQNQGDPVGELPPLNPPRRGGDPDSPPFGRD